MRRSYTQSLREVLHECLQSMNMETKLREVSVVQMWEPLLGKTIGRYTKNIYLSKGILYVELTSPVVKNELFLMREEIRNRLNDQAGEEIVKKIVMR
ncbi:MAG: DUF721 domain-containing protein [Mariniphaga sp.]|nr:DUF721 domain-containing protein [Mariniphaga sp.]